MKPRMLYINQKRRGIKKKKVGELFNVINGYLDLDAGVNSFFSLAVAAASAFLSFLLGVTFLAALSSDSFRLACCCCCKLSSAPVAAWLLFWIGRNGSRLCFNFLAAAAAAADAAGESVRTMGFWLELPSSSSLADATAFLGEDMADRQEKDSTRKKGLSSQDY